MVGNTCAFFGDRTDNVALIDKGFGVKIRDRKAPRNKLIVEICCFYCEQVNGLVCGERGILVEILLKKACFVIERGKIMVSSGLLPWDNTFRLDLLLDFNSSLF